MNQSKIGILRLTGWLDTRNSRKGLGVGNFLTGKIFFLFVGLTNGLTQPDAEVFLQVTGITIMGYLVDLTLAQDESLDAIIFKDS